MSSTARLTMGSLFGTVVTAAETVSGALGTVSNTVGMLNAYVENAAKQQQARFKNEDARFTKTLVIEGAQAEAEMELGVIAYCKKSDDHKVQFEKALAKYAKLHGLATEVVVEPVSLRVAAE